MRLTWIPSFGASWINSHSAGIRHVCMPLDTYVSKQDRYTGIYIAYGDMYTAFRLKLKTLKYGTME